MVGTNGFACLLIDLENLYLAFRDEFERPDELTLIALQNLRGYLERERNVSPIVARAYAPFDFSHTKELINDLALLGIVPVHVLAKAEKSSADLMLAIDAMELLYKRDDICTFVIVGGDRDYIPVLERIRQSGRAALVVCPRHAMSGDLRTIIGESSYLDAVELLPREKRTPLKWRKETAASAKETQGSISSTPTERPSQSPAHRPASMAEITELVDEAELEDLKKLMKLILVFGKDRNVNEVWLGPFLRTMNDAFPLKSHQERKNLVNRLRELGAVDIIQRPRGDEEGTYAVLTISWQHPLVLDLLPE